MASEYCEMALDINKQIVATQSELIELQKLKISQMDHKLDSLGVVCVVLSILIFLALFAKKIHNRVEPS